MKRLTSTVLFAAVAIASVAAGIAYQIWRIGPGELEGNPKDVAERVLTARFTDLKGNASSLEPWRGRVLVINFWGTWCPPCREEIPVFVRLQERHGARGLQFIGIALDQREKVVEFAQEFKINYPLLMGGLETMELMRKTGNNAGVVPYTMVFDRDGSLVSREIGEVKESRVLELVTPLL